MEKAMFPVVAALLLAACAGPQVTPMTGAEIQSEIVGQTFTYEGYDGGSFLFSGSLDVRENGALEFRTDTNEAEAGTWRLVENNVCITLEVLRSGAENCVSVSRLGPEQYQTSDGYRLTKT